MSGSCGTYGRQDNCIQGFGGKLEEKTLLGRIGVDGKLILKWIIQKWNGGIDMIDLAQDRDRWRAVENAVMNLRVL
jgi:hypothetical protein